MAILPIDPPGLPVPVRGAINTNFDEISDRLDIIELAIAALDRYALGNGSADDDTLQLVTATDVVVPFDAAGTGHESTVVLAAGTVSLDLSAFINVQMVLDVDSLQTNATTEFAIQLLDDQDAFVAEVRDGIALQGNQAFASVSASFDVDDVPVGFKFRMVMNQLTQAGALVDIVNYRLRVEWSSRPRGSAAQEGALEIVVIGSVGP